MNRELIMNKIFAVIFILFGAFTIPLCDWDGTFFLFTVILGVYLFFSKKELDFIVGECLWDEQR